MISVDEAREAVRRKAQPLAEHEEVPPGAALGRMLAEPLRADRDDPPFDRALMDGYAVRAADAQKVPVSLRIAGEVAAGDAALPRVEAGCAVRINTGAPLPPGADAIARVEETRPEGASGVTLLRALVPGADILRRGTLARAGEAVAEGPITPEKIAVCASIGASRVRVVRALRVAVLATGSELEEDPGAHAIRNSNGPMVRALLRGHEVTDLGVARDERTELEALLERGLAHDVLVTTGGVSKGQKDLVRAALEARGVRVLFHGIALQPGKPTLFGETDRGVVFALPGNPVAALVCSDLFVLPYLAGRAGLPFGSALANVTARLTGDAKAAPERRRLLPCLVRRGEATPLPWRGSADLYTVARGNAYAILEPGRHRARGETIDCLVPARHLASAFE